MNMTMSAKTRIILYAAVLFGAASSGSAGVLPNLDIQKICRASESASFADSVSTFDTCVSDELAAREELDEKWANIPATDKAHCVLPGEYLPGYVEWLTCLEMEREFRRIRQRQLGKQAARVPFVKHRVAAHIEVSGRITALGPLGSAAARREIETSTSEENVVIADLLRGR
jgi:hypothetical protein